MRSEVEYEDVEIMEEISCRATNPPPDGAVFCEFEGVRMLGEVTASQPVQNLHEDLRGESGAATVPTIDVSIVGGRLVGIKVHFTVNVASGSKDAILPAVTARLFEMAKSLGVTVESVSVDE